MKNVYILPLKSNPTIADSDYDGIVDENDEKPKKENTIEIDDEILDDSKVFEDDYKILNTVAVSGDGIAYSQEGKKRNNAICYSRVVNSDKAVSRYMIKPDKNSDYRITVDCAENDKYDISVYTKGLFGGRHDVEPVKKEGSTKGEAYVFESGEKYYIDITVKPEVLTDNSYEVKIEQDNWVYAPNGGIVTSENYIIGDFIPLYGVCDYSKIYYTKAMLKELLGTDKVDSSFKWNDITEKTDEFKGHFAYTISSLYFNDINMVLGINDDKYNWANDVSTLLTYVGAALVLGGPEVPFAIGAVVSLGGATTTTISIATSQNNNDQFKRTLLEAYDKSDDYNFSFEKYTFYSYENLSSMETIQNNWEAWNNKYIYQYNNIVETRRVAVYPF